MRKITCLGMFTVSWMSQLLVPALALNDTIGVTAGSGKTANLISFGSTNVISEVGICDATTENRCATVNASGQVLVTGPVTNAGTFAVQAAQSGTWTVQPGNTANTTAWLVTGTGGTFPVTQTTSPWVVSNGGTFATQSAITAASASISSGAYAVGSIASGADVTEGTTAETTVYAGSGGCTVVACLKGVYAAVTGSIPAGSSTIGNVNQVSMYPVGSTPITISATGTTGATTATLPALASNYTHICWLSIRANATAAATANSTVTGTVSGTLNFTQWTAPNASGVGLTEMIFNPCIPGSAVNTGIAVISAAPGTGGVVSVSAGGYQNTVQ